jgi:hypothetical protein
MRQHYRETPALNARLVLLAALFLVDAAVAPAETRGVNVAIDAAASGGGKPVIEGRTNLPDGTVLTVSLQPPNSVCATGCVPIEFETRVSDGHFRAGPFTAGGRNLPPGDYTLEIASNMARLQSVSVQAIIGPRGEYMIGKNVRVPGDGADEFIVDYISQVRTP